MLDEISTNVAEAIPYYSFQHKIKLVAIELRKNRHVEIMDEPKIIFSCEKWRDKDGDSGQIFN